MRLLWSAFCDVSAHSGWRARLELSSSWAQYAARGNTPVQRFSPVARQMARGHAGAAARKPCFAVPGRASASQTVDALGPRASTGDQELRDSASRVREGAGVELLVSAVDLRNANTVQYIMLIQQRDQDSIAGSNLFSECTQPLRFDDLYST